MTEFMSKGQAYLWNLEFDTMRWKVRYALNNIDNLSERNDVKGALEDVLSRLENFCEITKDDEGDDD
ncbi:hypothetical protein EBT31_07050 [bacterium]|nr:hypothetical protein [bacterium]